MSEQVKELTGNTNIKRSLTGAEAVIALSVIQLKQDELKSAVNAAIERNGHAEIIQKIMREVNEQVSIGIFPLEFLFDEILLVSSTS